MVARISHGTRIAGVLLYNKLKLDAGKGRVLLCHNLPLRPVDGRIDTRELCRAFEPWLSHPRSRVQEPVFHVSLNPHPGDKLDQMQLTEIATYYMEHMGYGDQPYVVYRHDDIARSHLHIVASRVQADGRAVNYQDYKKRSKALTEQIERLFGLIPAVRGQQQRPFEELRKVCYKDSDLKAQLASVLHHLTDRYRFASRGEFSTLLRLFNVWTEECRGEVAGRPYAGIIYGALDEHGEKVGKPLASSRLSRKFGYKALMREYESTKRWIRDNRKTLAPTRAAIREAMKRCRTAGEFAQALRPAGIAVIFHRSREHEGRIYGVTFIDHRNGLVVNGSRLDKGFAANRFQELFTARAQEPQTHPQSQQQTPPQMTTREMPDASATPTSTPEQDIWTEHIEAQPWEPHHGMGLLGVLMDEAARDTWEPWTPIPRRRRKKRHR